MSHPSDWQININADGSAQANCTCFQRMIWRHPQRTAMPDQEHTIVRVTKAERPPHVPTQGEAEAAAEVNACVDRIARKLDIDFDAMRRKYGDTV